MAMKLYSDVSVQNIANSIRKTNGSNTTYKISQMASAIDSSFAYIINNIPTNELNGATNQIETITDGTNLPIKNFTLNGKSSQTGTPTISNKIDVTRILSATITITEGNSNTRTATLDFDGYELYELQDGTKDTLRIENNHLYIDKKVKKVALTSEQNWAIYPANKAAYCAGFAANFGIEKLNYNMYSSHFTSSSTVWAANYKFGWGAASPNTTLWVSFNSTTPEFTTIAAFKEWLDENDCYIIAKATTPETIDLGAIENIFTFDGTNNITVTTNLGTTYELEYRKKAVI